MPAAAVIPAPIAYIKVVAVKKLVVDILGGLGAALLRGDHLSARKLSRPSLVRLCRSGNLLRKN